MIQRLTALLHTQYRNINSAAFMLAIFTFLGQLVGLLRERLLAGNIGPGDTLDIYVTAFQIPDFLFAVTASLVSVTILIPFLSDLASQGNDTNELRHFLSSVFTFFMWLMLGVSVIAFFLMPVLAHKVAPGFSPEMLTELIKTSRIMLLSPIFMGVSNLLISVTQLYRKFLVYALTPLVYNVGIIFGIFFLYPMFGVQGIAYGVVLGALLQVLINLPVIIRHGLAPQWLWRDIDWKHVWNVMSISVPRTLTLSLSQIVLVILIALATKIGSGAASIFRFALNLNNFPITIIGISYSVAAFPQMVELFTQGNIKEFINTVLAPARKIIFWSLPVIVLFIVLRAQIVRVVLGTGEFTWSDTRMTAAVLAILVISVAARGLVGLFVRGYYAAGKTWRPLIVNMLSTLFIILCALGGLHLFNTSPQVAVAFESLMRVLGVEHGARLLILAAAYSLGTLLNALVLWIWFKKEFIQRDRLITKSIFHSIIGSVIVGIVSYESLRIFAPIFNLDTFSGVFLQGFAAGMVGILFGILTLVLIKNEEVLSLAQGLRRRFVSKNK